MALVKQILNIAENFQVIGNSKAVYQYQYRFKESKICFRNRGKKNKFVNNSADALDQELKQVLKVAGV